MTLPITADASEILPKGKRERHEYVILPLTSYLNNGRKGALTVSYASPQSAARYAPVSPGRYVVLARDGGNVPRMVHAFNR